MKKLSVFNKVLLSAIPILSYVYVYLLLTGEIDYLFDSEAIIYYHFTLMAFVLLIVGIAVFRALNFKQFDKSKRILICFGLLFFGSIFLLPYIWVIDDKLFNDNII